MDFCVHVANLRVLVLRGGPVTLLFIILGLAVSERSINLIRKNAHESMIFATFKL